MQLAAKRLDHHVKKRKRLYQGDIWMRIKISVPLTQLNWKTRNYCLSEMLRLQVKIQMITEESLIRYKLVLLLRFLESCWKAGFKTKF